MRTRMSTGQAALAVCLLVFGGAALADEHVTATMNPTEGRPGDDVALTCSGVAASEVRSVEFTGASATVVSSSLSQDGRVVLGVKVPSGARTGPVHLLTRRLQADAGVFVVTTASVALVASETGTEGGGGAWNPTAGGARADVAGRPSSALAPVTDGLDLPIPAPVYVPPSKRKPKAPPPVTTDVPPPPPELPPTFYGKEIKSPSSSIVYVIDVSGSMGLDEGQYTGADGRTARGNRLERAKAELLRSVASLPRNFKLNLVSYDCSYETCFTKRGYSEIPLVPADEENKRTAAAWITSLRPLGSTGTGPAMSAALNYAPSNVLYVLLTDGAPNCGAGTGFSEDQSTLDAHWSQIHFANQPGVNGRERRATINVFGIGATGGFKQFCLRVAGDNDGTYSDVR